MARGAKCPKCKKRGSVIYRQDAFAIFKLNTDGSGKLIDTETFDNIDGYHCTNCDEELEEKEIGIFNAII